MNKKIFVLAPIVAILLVPVFLYAKFTTDCNAQYKAALRAKQPSIDEFGKIALLGERPAQKTKVTKGGDCVDSHPYASASKTYPGNMAGGQAVDTIRTNLKSSGYTITNENFGSEGCKLLYRVQAKNEAIKVSAVAFQKKTKDSTCTDGYPTGIPESHFRQQNIDAIMLNLMK